MARGTLGQAHAQAAAAIAAGGGVSAAAEGFSEAIRAAAQGWAQAWFAACPPPVPVCMVQLGSTARGEGLPGLRSSSDVDYTLLANGAQLPDMIEWARGLHAELERRGAEAGVEFCHKLNGVEHRDSPDSWFVHATSAFHAGNLCTARFLAGDRAVFSELESKVEAFHAEADGDPRAALMFLRPVKARFRAGVGAWAERAIADIAKLMKGLGPDPARVWKDALQVGVVALQTLAVLHHLEPRNTFARLDDALERGLVAPALGARIRAGLEHCMTQKAYEKLDLPVAAAETALPHLQAILELVASMRRAGGDPRDGFEPAPAHRALAPAAPGLGARTEIRPHELRAALARGEG